MREAYRFADQAHLGQFRASGSPISHPIAVTEICAGWKLDVNALSAALLHDVMEDQGVTKTELAEKFGPEVVELVDGLSKLDRLDFATKAEQQAESFRKMLLAMARDVRVILIKLADRLHNMRTLDAVNPESAAASRARRLRISNAGPVLRGHAPEPLPGAVQGRAGRARQPSRSHQQDRRFGARRPARRRHRGRGHRPREDPVRHLPQDGRPEKSFSDVLDIYGFRVIVHTLPECYLALGTLHQLYRPVPGKFKDYIAIPKVNGYQSLHTTLVGPYGTPWNSSSAPATCTMWPRKAWPRTGCTRAPT